MKRIIIIGGGVAGLAQPTKLNARRLKATTSSCSTREDKRLGGKIQTEIVPDPAEKGRFIVDGGPDCFLTEKPACHRIANSQGSSMMNCRPTTLGGVRGSCLVANFIRCPMGS